MDLKHAGTEELVTRFADEVEQFWILSNGLTLKESRKSTGRKDKIQKGLCIAIEEELKSRPPEEVLKLKRLLSDPRPGVRLDAAGVLEGYDFEAALAVYLELAQRNLGPDGYADPYGANARLALDFLVRKGKVPREVHPDYFDPREV